MTFFRPMLSYEEDDIVHAVSKLPRDEAVAMGFDDDVVNKIYYAWCDNDMFCVFKAVGPVTCLLCIAGGPSTKPWR
jgi:hypothetical protein